MLDKVIELHQHLTLAQSASVKRRVTSPVDTTIISVKPLVWAIFKFFLIGHEVSFYAFL